MSTHYGVCGGCDAYEVSGFWSGEEVFGIVALTDPLFDSLEWPCLK